jgi:hypothetical protein
MCGGATALSHIKYGTETPHKGFSRLSLMREIVEVLEDQKLQITNLKYQTNFKSQTSMTKTGLEFRIWLL